MELGKAMRKGGKDDMWRDGGRWGVGGGDVWTGEGEGKEGGEMEGGRGQVGGTLRQVISGMGLSKI